MSSTLVAGKLIIQEVIPLSLSVVSTVLSLIRLVWVKPRTCMLLPTAVKVLALTTFPALGASGMRMETQLYLSQTLLRAAVRRTPWDSP